MTNTLSTGTIIFAVLVAVVFFIFQYQGFAECEKNGGRMVYKMKNYYECVK